MHGLIIREPWLGRILSGEKTWEMRTTPTAHRGCVALIRKGTGMVVGVADLAGSLAPLDAASLAASRERHGIPAGLDEEVLAAGWVHPWVLRDVRALPRPVPAGQKPGQVIWVPLPDAAVVAIGEQLGAAAPRGSAAAPRSVPPSPAPVLAESPPTVEGRPRPAPPRAAANAARAEDEVTVELTHGAIRNGNLSVRRALHLLPDDAVGGPSRHAAAAGSVTVVFEPGETVETDVAGDKMLLRCRGAVSDFFARSAAMPGDFVRMRRDGARTLRVRIARR